MKKTRDISIYEGYLLERPVHGYGSLRKVKLHWKDNEGTKVE